MSSNVLEKFANKLKSIRKIRNLSQEQLALICNIDITYIERIENLKRNPRLIILQKIADGLEISLSELLDF